MSLVCGRADAVHHAAPVDVATAQNRTHRLSLTASTSQLHVLFLFTAPRWFFPQNRRPRRADDLATPVGPSRDRPPDGAREGGRDLAGVWTERRGKPMTDTMRVRLRWDDGCVEKARQPIDAETTMIIRLGADGTRHQFEVTGR